jgi:Ca2+-binding EF-hand superfamily protein|tara:strand:- start:46 stop:381 length:336 start_codon:yes stop_codon:yes gene_type:complete
MKKIILILTGVVLSFSVMADDHKSLREGPQARNFFKMADLDQDGKVSYAEHEVFVAMQADKGRERFNSMDANADGYVTKEEAKEARKTLMKRMKKFFEGKGRRDKEEAAKD